MMRYVTEKLSAVKLDKFTYTPLSNDHSIRLLDLDNGKDGDIIRCSLKEVDLNNSPDFDALSYSWKKDWIKGGSILWYLKTIAPRCSALGPREGDTREIICNGRILLVRENLYDALLQFRQLRRRRALWIDAVCINQDDIDERSSQVNIMGEIYGSAETVLVWLGRSTKGCKFALQLASRMPPYKEFKGIGGFDLVEQLMDYFIDTDTEIDTGPNTGATADTGADTGSITDSCKDVDDLIKPFSDDSLGGPIWPLICSYLKAVRLGRHAFWGFTELAAREWFQRTWVVQEIVLAKKVAFYVGPIEVQWTVLVNLSKWYFAILDSLCRQRSFLTKENRGSLSMESIFQARDEWSQGIMRQLDSNISLCRERKVSDPRDKVFGILSFSDKASLDMDAQPVKKGKRLAADYSKSVADVYLECTRCLLGRTNWPYVLSLVGKREEGVAGLPSWVPDYSVALRPSPFSSLGSLEFKAASSVQPSCRVYEDGKFLYLSAAQFDMITDVGECSDAFRITGRSRLKGNMLRLITAVGKKYEPTGEQTISAFWRTLIANFDGAYPACDELEFGFIRWLVDTFFEPAVGVVGGRWRDYLAFRPNDDSRYDGDSRHDGGSQTLATATDAFVAMHGSELFRLRGRPLNGGVLRPLSDESHPQNDESRQSSEAALHLRPGTTFSDALHTAYQDRRLFLTRNGYLGIGPTAVRAGDMVMLVAGGSLPFIFRPREGDGGGLRYIGESYVHGIMHGEALEAQELEFKSICVV